MRLIRSLSVGDEFRPAHPRQPSANRREMAGDKVYRVIKVYSQAPNYSVCEEVENSAAGIFTLPPGAPVVAPSESAPTEREVLKFLVRRKLSGSTKYRVLWSGEPEALSLLKPNASSLIKAVYATCASQVTRSEMMLVATTRVVDGDGRIGMTFPNIDLAIKQLISVGLIEEVDDELVPDAVRAANLQGMFKKMETT